MASQATQPEVVCLMDGEHEYKSDTIDGSHWREWIGHMSWT